MINGVPNHIHGKSEADLLAKIQQLHNQLQGDKIKAVYYCAHTHKTVFPRKTVREAVIRLSGYYEKLYGVSPKITTPDSRNQLAA